MSSHVHHLLLLLGLACSCCAAETVRLAMEARCARIGFDVTATMGSFAGTLRGHEAAVTVDPETNAVHSCTFAFRLMDLLTGQAKRDQQMARWLETKEHPDARFELHSVEATETDGVSIAKGTLTLHGVAAPLSFPLRVTRRGARMEFDGEAVVDIRQHGLPVIRFLGVCKVEPLVRVLFHLEGLVPEGAPPG